MREDDGRKLDHQTLEALRLRAVEQVARGGPAAQVGAGLAALGPHRRTIYTWLATERTAGPRGPASQAGARPAAQAHRCAAERAGRADRRDRSARSRLRRRVVNPRDRPAADRRP